MIGTLLLVVYGIFLWWLATGVVFFAVSLPETTVKPVIATASAMLLIAFYAISVTGEGGLLSAMVAFTAAIVVWGWGETMFLLRIVTGPNRAPCPPDATGLKRFRLATGLVIHHELLLVALGVVIAILATSPIAFATFATLWLLRLSAKFNLYLGTSNFSEDIAPHRLRYLSTYFRQARMNKLFPLSIIGGLGLAAFFWMLASPAAASEHDYAGYTLLCTLTLLGVFEHGMMMIPLRDGALWTWMSKAKSASAEGWATPRPRTGDTG